MKLYSHELSGHVHRVRLFASLIGLELQLAPVDLAAGAHKQPDFLAKNPFGQLPVLEDGDVTLYDSTAIIVYLASRYDLSGQWLPDDPQTRAEVQIWLSKAANEVANGIGAARLVTVFNAPYDHAAVIAKAHELLTILEQHLDGRGWLVGDSPTLAEVALYSYIAHGPEGGVDLRGYPRVSNWLQRIENLPGFVPMQATDTAAKQALQN
ncbi:MAG: glutathione S-transferase [Wenzhouxiangellaceae bacterium]